MKKLLTFAAVAVACSAFAAPPTDRWEHSSKTDDFTSETVKSAIVASANSLSLSSPYQGQNLGALLVRERKQDGLNVIFAVQKGQILCRRDSCPIAVRIDENEPMRLQGTRASDGSSNMVFLPNPQKMIDQLKTATKVRVQVEMYQQGNQTLTFTPGPLEWSK